MHHGEDTEGACLQDESNIDTDTNVANVEDIDDNICTPDETNIDAIAPDDSNIDSIVANALFAKVRQYSTTSTVLAASTITNPNVGEILICLGYVLQSQICEDENLNSESVEANLFEEFNRIPELSSEFSALGCRVEDSHALSNDAVNDQALQQKILTGTVPSLQTIYRFLSIIYSAAQYSPECNIIALIYINRMASLKKMPLSMKNWRAVWLACVILAQKVWDDKPLKTGSFSSIIPSFTVKDLRKMEVLALNSLDFATGVKPSLYAKYYFELRLMYSEITGVHEWSLTPLTTRQSLRLDARSHLADKRAKTYEDIVPNSTMPPPPPPTPDMLPRKLGPA